jgi:L-asparaginase
MCQRPRIFRAAMIITAFLLALASAAGSADDNAPDPAPPGLPRVHVIATGGTIAGAQARPGEYGYTSGSYDVATLLAAVPDVQQLAQISGEQLVNIGSQDMNDTVWLKLAQRLAAVLAEDAVDAVLITHGTDTLEETAYFLSLVTGSPKPVVMVGAMRPANAISADGPGNLYNGVAVAVDRAATGRGTLVCLNDEIHYARNVVKTNTTSVQTFSSVNRGPAGLVHSGVVQWFGPTDKKVGAATGFSVDGLQGLPRVDIIYAHAGMRVDLIEAAVRNGARGIVLAGVGDGNMTAEALQALRKAAAKGVVVVRSTRLPSGVVLRNNEINDDEYGFVASGEFGPPKARVLLQLALTRTSDPAAIQQMFYQY